MTSKYSTAERERIMAQSRAHISASRHQQRSESRVVHKTNYDAAVPPDDAADAAHEPDALAAYDWSAWWSAVDERIAHAVSSSRRFMREAFGIALAQYVDKALDVESERWEKKFSELRHEVVVARDELKIASGLASLRGEIDAAREQQPSFTKQLNELRVELAKTQKLASRQRVEISQLEFRLGEMDKVQTRVKASLSKTTTLHVDLSAVGADTREALERLRADGGQTIFDLTPIGSA